MGELGAYIFPRGLAPPRPIATAAKPYCHSSRDHSQDMRRAQEAGVRNNWKQKAGVRYVALAHAALHQR